VKLLRRDISENATDNKIVVTILAPRHVERRDGELSITRETPAHEYDRIAFSPVTSGHLLERARVSGLIEIESVECFENVQARVHSLPPWRVEAQLALERCRWLQLSTGAGPGEMGVIGEMLHLCG
jgi:hypothetical protein